MYIDSQDKEYILVYLGDIGRSLNNKEQIYWKSFNILCDKSISVTRFKRDFLAQFNKSRIYRFNI